MALVDIVSFGILDFTGGRKTLPIYFADPITLTQADDFISAGAPLLDALIDGQIIDAVLTLSRSLPGGLKTSPVAGNTAREGALLSIEAAGTVYTFDSYVPSVSNSHFIGNLLNDTDTAVTDWYTEMTGPGGGQPDPTDKNANDLTTVRKAVRAFRK